MSLFDLFKRRIPAASEATAFETAFLQNLERFKQYNTGRIELLRGLLPENRRNIFDLIPFLLHEDAPVLPGNDLGRPLSGVSCFTLLPRVQPLVKKYFPELLVEQEYQIPPSLILPLMLKQFILHPIKCTYVFVVNRYCQYKARRVERKLSALWQIAQTTKHL